MSTLEADDGARGAGGALPALRLRLHAIRYEAQGIHLFEFRDPAGAPLPRYAAGAHVDLHLPNGLVRQYSLTGASADADRYVVAVKRDPRSRGGSACVFDQLRVGDSLVVGRPRNHFALREAAAAFVLIAGGIGITPIRAMVERLATLGRPWQLHYAVRCRAEAAFLTELAEHPDNVRLHIDDESDGRLLDVGAIVKAAPHEAELYCCGPAPMLEAFEAAAGGRPAGTAHVERFAAAPGGVPGLATDGGDGPTATGSTPGDGAPPAAFVVELARSGRRLPVGPGQSIAAALKAGGVAVAVSCEQGVCGTCETRVVAGLPDHRDSLLSADEKAANDVMMICCSRSLTGTLVLDL